MSRAAAVLAVKRDVPDAVMPVAVVDVDRLGDVCRSAVGHRRHIGRLCDICRRRWRDIGRRAAVDWLFVCDASRAVDAKRRYRKKHFSRVVHGTPAFLFTRCEGLSLPISDRKRFRLHYTKTLDLCQWSLLIFVLLQRLGWFGAGEFVAPCCHCHPCGLEEELSQRVRIGETAKVGNRF